MAACNGRLLPRHIFGVPLPAVILAAGAFLLMIILLLPLPQLHTLRPFVVIALLFVLLRTHKVLKIGQRMAILPAIHRASVLGKARRIYE